MEASSLRGLKSFIILIKCQSLCNKRSLKIKDPNVTLHGVKVVENDQVIYHFASLCSTLDIKNS
jgi:hypothetical protein